MPYVHDDRWLVNTVGLRIASLSVNNYREKNRWHLLVYYKGQSMSIDYETEEEARPMFEELIKAVKSNMAGVTDNAY